MSVEHYTILLKSELNSLLEQGTWQIESSHPLDTGDGDDTFMLHAIKQFRLPDPFEFEIEGDDEIRIHVTRNPDLTEGELAQDIDLVGTLKEARQTRLDRIELVFGPITREQRSEARSAGGFWRQLDTEDPHNPAEDGVGLILVKPRNAPPGWALSATGHPFPMTRTPMYALPAALRPEDVVTTGEVILSEPRVKDHLTIWIKIGVYGWCAVHAHVPVALKLFRK